MHSSSRMLPSGCNLAEQINEQDRNHRRNWPGNDRRILPTDPRFVSAVQSWRQRAIHHHKQPRYEEAGGHAHSQQTRRARHVYERRSRKAGARRRSFALVAANTPHLVFDAIARQSRIPLISIVEATAEAAKAGVSSVWDYSERASPCKHPFIRTHWLPGKSR